MADMDELFGSDGDSDNEQRGKCLFYSRNLITYEFVTFSCVSYSVSNDGPWCCAYLLS